MPRLHADDFQLVEGLVTDVIDRPGVIQFQVSNQWFGLRTARARVPPRLGERVRMLVDDSRAQPIIEVLVLQRIDDPKVEYTGPGVSAVLAFLAAVLIALAVDEGIWWLAASAALLALAQLKFSIQKERMLRKFSRLQQRPADEFAFAPAGVADVPLTLPNPSLAPGEPTALPAQILEFTHDAIIIWELDGGIVYWNRAAEQLYGYTRQEACGKVIHQLLKTRLAGTIGELEAQVARYGMWIGDLRHTRRDGQPVDVEARLSLMSQEHRPWLVLEVNRDVTDRNRAEAARQEIVRQLERVRQQERNAAAASARQPPGSRAGCSQD
jgi:PAS domain S-box-containing protein